MGAASPRGGGGSGGGGGGGGSDGSGGGNGSRGGDAATLWDEYSPGTSSLLLGLYLMDRRVKVSGHSQELMRRYLQGINDAPGAINVELSRQLGKKFSVSVPAAGWCGGCCYVGVNKGSARLGVFRVLGEEARGHTSSATGFATRPLLALRLQPLEPLPKTARQPKCLAKSCS